MNQMPRSPQEAIARVGQIAGLLLHPRAARLRMDPGDGHAAGLQLDHEEDKIPPEPCQRQHLDREQIAGREALPVRLQETSSRAGAGSAREPGRSRGRAGFRFTVVRAISWPRFESASRIRV